MIVRNAVFSDEPYTVSPAVPGADMIRDAARPVPARRPQAVAAPLPVLVNEVSPASPVTSAVTSAPVPPAFTPVSVAAWLAEQDRDVLLTAIPGLATELADIRDDAYAAGFSAGQLAGRAEASQQTEQLHAMLKATVEALSADCERQQTRLAAQCVDIVAVAIGKIAGPLLATREAALGAVTAALAQAKPGLELTVRVHPADLPWLEPQQGLLAGLVSGAALHLVADAQVMLGGCFIDSPVGTLDARLEVQLQGLCETLRTAREGRSAS